MLPHGNNINLFHRSHLLLLGCVPRPPTPFEAADARRHTAAAAVQAGAARRLTAHHLLPLSCWLATLRCIAACGYPHPPLNMSDGCVWA
jgi:hypothetical protein